MSTKPFDACPYCLTEIANTAATPPLSPNDETARPSKVPIEEHPQAAANPLSCNRHLGYLSERGAKDPIPDDCLTCMEIVQCMLRKANDQANIS